MKEASEIHRGDVVFCIVQPTQQYYAHIVLNVQWDGHLKCDKYWIGNIQQRYNGYCYREHIFGILTHVQVLQQPGVYWNRPLPRDVYDDVL